MHIHDHERYVCPACVDDAALKAFIESEAANEECSFCGTTSEEAIAAPLDELISHIRGCLLKEYDDPANCLSYCSEDGGYQGETFDADEILFEVLELPNDNGDLFSAISQGLSDQLWCRRDP
jgi:hypothetical protein